MARPLDSITKRLLQRWLLQRERVLPAETRILLERLHQFASQIETEEGGRRISECISNKGQEITLTELVRTLAEKMCEGIPEQASAMLSKSLQETLFYYTGLKPDLNLADFSKRLRKFVRSDGSEGLIQLFLGLYLFQLIWIDLHDALSSDCPTASMLARRARAVEHICGLAAAMSISRWKKRPHLEQLENEVKRTLSNAVQS